MKVKIEDKSQCQKLIKIEISADMVNEALNEEYTSIEKNASISGFRKGKVPRDLLESHYADTAKQEAVQRLIWQAYRETIQENNIKPVSYPIVEDVNFKKDEPLSFSIKIDVRPEFRLKSYKGIKIKEKAPEVKQEDVDKTMELLRQQCADFKDAGDREAKEGDFLLCDYDCLVEGKSVDSGKNIWLNTGNKNPLAAINKALIGCRKGQTKEASMKLPDDFKNKEFAGRDAIYKISIKELKERILPPVDDELAKKLGGYKNLLELKEGVRKELLERSKSEIKADMEKQLFDAFLKANQFDVPDSVVQSQLTGLVNDAKIRLAYQGYKKEEIDSQEEKLKEALGDNAVRQVRIFFIMEAIAQQENIKASEQELNKRIEELARSRGRKPDELKEEITKKDMMDNLKEQIVHDKVVDFLMEERRSIR